MKKVLILGASILQLPAIRKAKELGCYVGVADYNPNAIGIREADEYFNISTIDVDGVVKTAQAFSPDCIMTLATDMPMRAVAKACEVCGLPGISYETAVKATDKEEMIKAFEAYGVEHPWYRIASDFAELTEIADKIAYPCVMKPVDNAGSRGVVLVHNSRELEQLYTYSFGESRRGKVIVEEYLQGPEFSVEIMVVDGEPYVVQITDKHTTGAPHFVEMGHSQPSTQSPENQEKIRDLACRAVKAVGIDIGPAHVEIILTNSGPKMVELGARLGGDCIATDLVLLSTGIDMVECTILQASGEKISLQPSFAHGSAIRYFDVCGGTIKAVDGVEKAVCIPGVKEIMIVHPAGDTVEAIKSSTDRIGFVIAQADTPEEAIRICEKAKEEIIIKME